MKPLLVVTGPTASGKSGIALRLAQQLGGEIVSCDSMQIYRGCDIATAKPTRQERHQVPHYLIDVCDPDERYSAAKWAQEARLAIEDIESRGQVPILCGGTGFYLKALLNPSHLSSVEPNEELRSELQRELEALGAAAMHEKLASLDEAAAARLHPNDSFRVVRALEIELGAEVVEEDAVEWEREKLILAIDWPRELLYKRIGERVDAMLEAGMMEELRALAEKWGRDAPALSGVGYKQMMPVLDDESTFAECLEEWKRDTRRYAKRQMTWFRHQLDVTWLDGTRGVRELVRQVEEVWNLSA